MPVHYVLIVDDHREVGRTLAAGLNRLQTRFAITTAASGEEALLAARLRRFDLLIAEVRLAGLTGLDLMKRLLRTQPQIKAILMSEASDQSLRREAVEAGAAAFFAKPIDLPLFLVTIEEILRLAAEETLAGTGRESPAPAGEHPPESRVPPPVTGHPLEQRLTERLTRLRQATASDAVAILNDRAQIVAQAGDLAARGIEDNLLQAVMPLVFAGQKISLLLGVRPPRGFTYLPGAAFDLALSPVGQNYTLLAAASQPLKDRDQLGLEVFRAAEEVLLILEQMGVPLETEPPGSPTSPSVPDSPEPEAAAVDSELEALIAAAAPAALPAEVIDSFWDPARDRPALPPAARGDALTYQQARQLGLTPTEDEG